MTGMEVVIFMGSLGALAFETWPRAGSFPHGTIVASADHFRLTLLADFGVMKAVLRTSYQMTMLSNGCLLQWADAYVRVIGAQVFKLRAGVEA